MPIFVIQYGKNDTIELPYPENPIEGKCDACGRLVNEIEHKFYPSSYVHKTFIHHWKVGYNRSQLKRNPWVVIPNINELCMGCLRDAKALMTLSNKKREQMAKAANLLMIMPRHLVDNYLYMNYVFRVKKKELLKKHSKNYVPPVNPLVPTDEEVKKELEALE